jgi:hypothetical protein
MVVERMLFFLPVRFKKIKLIGINKFSFILFSFSAVVSLPISFLFVPGHVVVPLDENTLFDIYFWSPSQFSQTFTGKLIANIMNFIRDVLTPIFKIVLNVVLVILVRKYIKRLRLEKREFAIKISTAALHEKPKNEPGLLIENQNVYINIMNKNQTYLAIIMCSLSFIEHLFLISWFVVYFINNGRGIAGLFYYLALLSIGIKHSSSFFVFYKFNFLFRAVIKKIFTIKITEK